MTHTPAPTARWSDVLTRANAAPLAITCLAVFLHAADGLLTATMLPTIVEDIGGLRLISWVVMLYEVGSIVMGAACGLLIARRGLRGPMTLAAIVFALGCLVSGVASTMPVLLAGRVLQGLGGGGLMAMAFVALTLLFAPHLRARVIGALSTVWAASAFLGPLIGGAFVEFATWRAAFFSFTAVALLLALWLWTRIPADLGGDDAGEARFPVTRLALLLGAIMMIAYGGEHLSPVTTPLLIAGGIALLAAFLWRDAQTPATRLLPRFDPLLRDGVSAIMAMIFFFAATGIAVGTFAPYFLTVLHGFSALAAGSLVALEAILWATTAALISGRPEREDARNIALGLSLVGLSIVGFALSVASGPIWLIAASAAAQGIGFGAAFTFMPRMATRLCHPQDQAVVAAAVPTVQRTGYAVGAAFLGIVANMAGLADGQPEAAARWIFIAGLPFVAVGLLAVVRLWPHRHLA
ncbi:MFS transporter [Sulfitobacter albidus]|uniref:MFS transporter n=1 Tax=Sulfitobacter albidus TaxID=2829501 RepID=A0A975JBZ0_9RHOB|nr:MFS transporter [Sulfitobacter albidus]QUJ75445.1 MFS transporter [Sulfitobacter albidus]